MSLKKRSFGSYANDGAGEVPPHAPYALYGNPLPAYNPEVRDDGTYVPVWKQEVTDERGRKRLHGAFTGGWSAGYFNTVGSKEGWTPSTFKSSRSSRADKLGHAQPKEQRPEDFMDEEDLAMHAESQKLETVGNFAGLGETDPAQGPKGMFSDLFKTTGETMGLKLLQRMGWRLGQGIGPRVRRRAQGDKSGETHLFAPENSKVINLVRKTDRKGVGYVGEGQLAAGTDDEDANSDEDASILKRGRSKLTVKPGKLKKKSGIGIGVLNDTGSDDEDSLTLGPSLSYNRVIGGDKRKGKLASDSISQKSSTTTTSSTSNRVAKLVSGGTSSGFRKCHDGRLPLPGFVLAERPVNLIEVPNFVPPTIPDGWKSSKLYDNNVAEQGSNQNAAELAESSKMDFKARASVLGEQPLPGKSIFDFISPAVREKLAAATGKDNLPQGRGEKAPNIGSNSKSLSDRRTLWDLFPALPKETASAALNRVRSGFKPYEDDGKSARYRGFLEIRAGLQSQLPERPSGFSLDDWSNEFKEFAKAATVFKPMSGLMALRFTSSSERGPNNQDTLYGPSIEEDPAENAAKNGMFGPLTRAQVPFYPTRLLCKRFGVPPPANVVPDSAETDSSKLRSLISDGRKGQILSQDSVYNILRDTSSSKYDDKAVVTESELPIGRSTSFAEVVVERNEALEGKRADSSILKAVFGDDDESH